VRFYNLESSRVRLDAATVSSYGSSLVKVIEDIDLNMQAARDPEAIEGVKQKLGVLPRSVYGEVHASTEFLSSHIFF
jgi:hypothetical protein